MMPKGEHEQDFLMLFEGLEQLGARYQQQLGALSQIPAHGRILGIHRIAAGNKGYHTTGTHLI